VASGSRAGEHPGGRNTRSTHSKQTVEGEQSGAGKKGGSAALALRGVLGG